RGCPASDPTRLDLIPAYDIGNRRNTFARCRIGCSDIDEQMSGQRVNRDRKTRRCAPRGNRDLEGPRAEFELRADRLYDDIERTPARGRRILRLRDRDRPLDKGKYLIARRGA